MAMNSSSNPAASAQSPPHSSENQGSPLSPPTPKTATQSWTQVVRSESTLPAEVSFEPTACSATATPQSGEANTVPSTDLAENASGSNGNAGKKAAWNKPSNGVVPVAEVGPVMGAASWPALSESARVPSKSPSDSAKVPSDGSFGAQGTGTSSHSSQKQVGSNASPNATPNHVPTRQRSMKRNNSNSSSSNQQFHAPPASSGMLPNNRSPRDHPQRVGYSSQFHGGTDHQQHRNSFRNRNGGSHSHGDGSHHHNYGSRREQDRGNQNWGGHHNFNGRGYHMQSQRGPQRFTRPSPPPPPSTAQFIPPPVMRPLGGPMGFPEMAPSVIYFAHAPDPLGGGIPFVPPIPPVYIPTIDPQLPLKIVNQIDYYFSNENLVKDLYLRENMDDQGWVPVKLIAGFKKVTQLTDNIQLILDALRMSNVVEVQGDKLRRRQDWKRWIMPSALRSSNMTAQSPGLSSQENLTAQIQGISLDEKAADNSSARDDANFNVVDRLSSEELNGHSEQLSGGDGTSQVSS